MDPSRLERAEQIFNEVADLPKGDRTRLLDQRCADDPDLRTLVADLLSHDAADRGSPDAFLSRLTTDEPAIRPSLPPLRIGAYEIVRLIGEGGMGSVYEARQDNPRRSVALKIIRGWFAPREMVNRLRREAQLLGAMHHPGIAAIYEAGVGRVETARGVVGEQPYIAMELVRGPSLLEYARLHSLTVRQRLDLFALVCDAVHHAHTRGVIHRDIKPSNILVDENALPKVLDFGVARAANSDVQATTIHTDPGRVIGTLQYMSPEQVEGNPEAIDARADVYALGAVLYEILVGRPPLDLATRSVPEAARIIAEEEPTRLSSLDTTLRGDIETITAKALAKEKERRYASAGDLAADIRRFLSDQPIEARPTSTFYQLRKFAKRNKILVGGVVGVILALTLGLIGTGVFAARTEHARAAATAAAAAALRSAYRSSLAAAQAALNVGNGDLARQNLALADPKLRGWEWRYLDWMADRRQFSIDLGPVKASDMCVSADGRFIVTACEDNGIIRIWNADTGGAAASFDTGLIGPKSLALAPDSSRILVIDRSAGKRSVSAYRFSSGERLWIRNTPLECSGAPFDPSGRFFYAAWQSNPIACIDAETGETLRTFPVPGRLFAQTLTVSPDGSRVMALAEIDGTILCFSATSGDVIWRSQPLAALGFQVAPRAGVIATCDALIDLDTGKTLRPLESNCSIGTSIPAVSSDGTLVASYSPHRDISVFDARADENVATLAPPAPAVSMSFLADSANLAVLHFGSVSVYHCIAPSSSFTIPFADFALCADSGPGVSAFITCGWGDVRRWSSRDLAEEWTTVFSRGACYAVDLSPDNSRIAVASQPSRLTILSFADGAVLNSLDLRGMARGPVAWSRDSSRLRVGLANGEIVEIDPGSGRTLRSFAAHKGELSVLMNGPAGQSFVSCAPGELRLWDPATDAPLRSITLPGQAIRAAAFSRSGSLFAVGTDDRSVILWRTDDWSEVMHARLSQVLASSIAFSADDDRLVVGAADGSISVWSIPSPDSQPTLVLPTPYGSVNQLYFSPDGASLFAMGNSGVCEFATRDSASYAEIREVVRRARLFLLLSEPDLDYPVGPRAVRRILRVAADQRARIAQRPDLPPDVRDAALRIAVARADNPNWLNSEAWRCARDPSASADEEKHAIRLVRRALEIFPNDPAFMNTLGIAQYRAGLYREAADTLSHAIESARRNADAGVPDDLLFLALAYHRLGDAGATERTLRDLHAALPTRVDPESELAEFLREAEADLGPLR